MNVAIGGLCHCSCSFWYVIPERTRTMTEPSDSYIHNLGPTVPVANINSSTIGNIVQMTLKIMIQFRYHNIILISLAVSLSRQMFLFFKKKKLELESLLSL